MGAPVWESLSGQEPHGSSGSSNLGGRPGRSRPKTEQQRTVSHSFPPSPFALPAILTMTDGTPTIHSQSVQSQGYSAVFEQILGSLPEARGTRGQGCAQELCYEAWTIDGSNFLVRFTNRLIQRPTRPLEETIISATAFGLTMYTLDAQDAQRSSWELPNAVLGTEGLSVNSANASALKASIESTCIAAERQFQIQADSQILAG